MGTKRLQIQGISRDKAPDSFGDGECQEIINMRLRDSQWRVRRKPLKEYNNLGERYRGMWYHDQDGVGKWIGLLDTTSDTDGSDITGLFVVDPATGTRTLIKEYPRGANIRVKFLKRFLLVVTESNIDKFIFKDGTYRSLNIFLPPRMKMSYQYAGMVTTDGASTPEAIVGKFQKMIIDENNRYSKLPGGIFIRMAYRLFDGTFALHTLPYFINIGDWLNMNLRDDPYRTDNDEQEWQIQFHIGILIAEIERAYFQTFPEMQDIISSVVIFATKPETLYEVSTDSITQDMLDSIRNNQSKTFAALGVSVNDKFRNMVDATYYKVKEISFQSLIDDNAPLVHPLDTKGFWLGYAAREILTVDNNTYHNISGQSVSVYNDRLIIGKTRTTFGLSDISTLPYSLYPIGLGHESLGIYFGYNAVDSPYNIYLLVTITTGQGIAYALNPISGQIGEKDGKKYVIFGNRLVGYPDRRATEAKLIIQDATLGVISVIALYTLTASTRDNFAYYVIPDFAGNEPLNFFKNFGYIVEEIDFANTIPTLEPYTNALAVTDENRIQLSELRNPFMYPVKYSYQVGTGAIIATGVNTEPMSSGQYGQYPLIVFTTKGIFALEQGSGDVLFASISPLSGDIAKSEDQIINVSNGVLYVSERGVYAIFGKEVIEISKLIEGEIDTNFVQNDHFAYFVGDPRLGYLVDGLVNRLSKTDALTFISGAIIGYDKINNEVVFSNPERDLLGDLVYRYSYVYSLETATWHKIDHVFELFVSNYPFLYGLKVFQGSANGIYNLGQDSSETNISVLIATQPQSFDEPGIYKKINRMVLRAMLYITPGTYFTFAVFASDDLRTWQLLTGGQRSGGSIPTQNILCTRTHGSATYYRLVMVGQLHPESSITGIDLTTVPRLNRKLRP